jgi:serine phosphatase RsbU (regulator of sigma subunit)
VVTVGGADPGRPDGGHEGNGTPDSPILPDQDVDPGVALARLRAAYAAERAAREEAERSHSRLTMLAEAATFLNGTLDPDIALNRLARLVVPQLADWTAIHLLSEDGELRDIAYRHREGLPDIMQRYAQVQLSGMTSESPVSRVLTDGAPLLVKRLDRSVVEAATSSSELPAIVERLGICSLMVVPLVARRRVLGTMALVSGSSGRVFEDADLEVAADLGRRAGLALDNARLYEREHRAAEVLQRSLLPDVPPLDGVEVAVRYIPGSRQAEVGGDFYELLDLPDGAIGVAVGDVVGHDLAAAAAMGHLRGLLRACAWDTAADDGGDPGRVLERVDRLVQGLHVAPLATVFYGRLDRPATPGTHWRLTHASAGHPAPLLRNPDGTVTLLEEAGGLILGIGEGVTRTSARVAMPSGSLLLAYTDGLVERRGRDIDEGLRWVQEVTASTEADPELLVQVLTDAVGRDLEDDLAVLAIRLS